VISTSHCKLRCVLGTEGPSVFVLSDETPGDVCVGVCDKVFVLTGTFYSQPCSFRCLLCWRAGYEA
jgi:hypothetical protein